MASTPNPNSKIEAQDKAGNKIESSDNTARDKFNVEAADALANKALHMPISEAIPVYEQLLAVFPTAAKYWKQYVEAHMAVNDDDATKQIFSRCLLSCLQIPLWRCYIRFIRKANDKKGAEGQLETRKAYDFMLSYVGADISSGPVWMEYISFLKSLPVLSPQEESQRMTAMRKIYQKAVITPTHHIEQLWRDYENFENSVSRQLAKGLITEYQPKYNSARAVYRERKKYIDEIDLNILAVPPSGSSKEEQQWMAWKKLLAFEKNNPQRIDIASSNKRVIFTYEQCLMYLYHYPDVWYDYATWHAANGSIDSAVKVYQRAIKALPESETLRYAYAELEESRGAIQPAKKVYEGLLGDAVNASALAHIQYIRFLRRTEGVEAARKYFLDARNSPNCTYQVFVAYAQTVFCLDKNPKVAHNVFEAGLKQFIHEPHYILEYADFLSRLNDDRNIRALFERALSTLPPEESVEVWKKFAQFEQTYGDLASILKVEQRKKEALAKLKGDADVAEESSLQDIVSRYSFMDLWPCSAADLDHLARQEWLSKNINRNSERSTFSNGLGLIDKSFTASNPSTEYIFPDTSRMVVYDPTLKHETGVVPSATAPASENSASTILSNPTATVAMANGAASSHDDILKVTPPALLAFLAGLPIADGPTPDVDIVLSICLLCNIPTGQAIKSGSQMQRPTTSAPSTSNISGNSKSQTVGGSSSLKPTRDRHYGKRKESDRQEDDETSTVQSQPLPRDVFRIRQIRKARGTSSQTGSVSYGSALSGDLSGSTG